MSQKLKPHDLDLLRAYHVKPTAAHSANGRVVGLIAVPAALALLFAGGTGALYFASYQLDGQITALRQQIAADDEANAGEKDALEQLKSYVARANHANEIAELMASYPLLDKALFDSVQTAAGTSIALSSYKYDGGAGTLTISATAEGAKEITAFLRRLNSTGRFASVSSGGYDRREELYEFQAVCTVKSGKETTK